MGITQLDFERKTKVQVAIERLRIFEPSEGYYLAFSGGKDSIVIYDLAVKAGVKFDAHYSLTNLDPPELVQFIKKYYPNVTWERPEKPIWRRIVENSFPTRQQRWCCEEYKENGGTGRLVVTGVRWAESARRKQRKMVEVCNKGNGKSFLHPIIDFETSEVWEYIRSNHLPYCSLYDEGFDRLGCVLCPMKSPEQTKKEIERWPELADAWRRAFHRLYEYRGREGNHSTMTTRWSSADERFEWWITREHDKQRSAQCFMFE